MEKSHPDLVTSILPIVDASSPPTSNTGGGLPRRGHLGLGSHWWRFSFPGPAFPPVLELATEYFGDPEDMGHGLFLLPACLAFPLGAKLAFDPVEGSTRRCVLDLPGDLVAGLEVRDLMELLHQVDLLGARCTRVDCVVDDYAKRITPGAVHAHAEAGDVARFSPDTAELKVGGYWVDGQGVRHRGETFNIGRRGKNGSGAYLRYYRKDVESQGETDAFRWEMEFSQEKADLAFRELLKAGTPDEFVLACGGLVLGNVDFPIRTGDAHLDRLERHAWWIDLTSDIWNSVRLRVKRVAAKIQDKAAWIRDGVAGSMKAVLMCLRALNPGDTWSQVRRWVDEAELTPTNKLAVRQWFAHAGLPVPSLDLVSS